MDYTVKSHIPECNAAIKKAMETALEACGMVAEGYAKDRITSNGNVDTGLLRNSITYAISGKGAHTSSYKADVGGKTGTYSGTIEGDGDDVNLYLGTNVEYGPYIEYGTGSHSTTGGGTKKKSWVYQDSQGNTHHASPRPAHPFIKPAFSEHIDEYKKIIAFYLAKEMNNK